MESKEFYKVLKRELHNFNLITYSLTNKFPKSELYGTISQLRRASISIMLNFLEGYARFKPKVKLNFFETSYGSCRESKYLIFFALEMKWITREDYDNSFKMVDSIGAMLWSVIKGLEKQISEEDK